jgi:hypothetical protein
MQGFGYFPPNSDTDLWIVKIIPFNSKESTMSKQVKLPAVIEKFITATNDHNGDGFIGCFAEDAYANDAARSFWGKEQIKKWSDKEMIDDRVTMKPDTIVEHYGDYMITALTDGNYDKKLAPDPLYLDYFFTVKDDKIIKMFVILNKEKSVNKK